MASLEKADQQALDVLTNNSVYRKLQSYYSAYSDRRDALGLSNPGTIDNISKEVQRDVFLNNLAFSGLRADLTKAFSVAPLFQVSHALSMGSQALPPYAYAALYGSPKIFMQANIDNDFSLSGRFNYRWTNSLVTKTSMQVAPGPGQSMLQLENDYTGADFSASIKAMNPSILDGGLTGIFIGSYLQAVTKRLSLGLEGVYERAAMTHGPQCMLSYAARYKGDDWIASGQVLASGGIQGSYWRKLTERVEAGASVNLEFAPAMAQMMGAPSKDATTTIGAKYDFRASSFRAQVDSKGKLGCLLEKRVAPPVQVTFSGEIDHAKNAAKVGLGVSIEAADEEVMMQQEGVAAASAPPPF
ncbi:putative mitochondrial import receptor subunit [Diplodia seriata]|uniref:Translocase of outer membrane 40 kDa subunit n=2 Tax=Diplodia TaxID=66735 RepID=A0A0G2E326_9PEZI|nr:putative mitochondrial import receptor subunit [Diplodia seriata]OMP87791.1 Mitochondrial import receptor subunit tom-40 [Diplodia seriata]